MPPPGYMTPSATPPPGWHVPSAGSDTLWSWRRLALPPALAVFVAGLAVLATRGAQVPFTLRVAGTHADLFVDGQTLHTRWPSRIYYVYAAPLPPNARLFQVDGTDLSGTETFDPPAFTATARTAYYRFLCWLRDCSSYSRWRDASLRDDRSGRLLLYAVACSGSIPRRVSSGAPICTVTRAAACSIVTAAARPPSPSTPLAK